MKIVIDIPNENDYNAIRDNIKAYSLADMLFEAVKSGIPLPKGYGDLIDRDELKIQMPTPIEDEYKTAYRIIDNAPAIIPADEGE